MAHQQDATSTDTQSCKCLQTGTPDACCAPTPPNERVAATPVSPVAKQRVAVNCPNCESRKYKGQVCVCVKDEDFYGVNTEEWNNYGELGG